MSDIIRPIEPFELTQGFGSNPDWYKKFGLAGHNGWDFRTKFTDTPEGRRYIMASWLMQFYRRGSDPQGYGLFFETVCKLKSTWKLTYAHCHSIEDFTVKNEGENMAISDNTGNSTGAHLHLTVKRIKIIEGKHVVQNYENGYFGAVNPQEYFNELRLYKKNNNAPSLPNEEVKMEIDKATFEHLVNGATVRKELAIYLGLENPDHTQLDKFKSHYAGKQSQITSLENDKSNLIKDLELAKTEIANQLDKVANQEAKCQRTVDALKAQIDALNGNSANVEILRRSYEGMLKEIEGQLRDKQKEVGLLQLQLKELEAETKSYSRVYRLYLILKDFLRRVGKGIRKYG